ncbi:helix-turn-helix transcriptional regulator [uncultured Clostridium sp.]|uniref:helix-turn-helix domain-containing protein n=1 Tax=uncultured Clostridium sp. TaxID=59620 RepID=UPI0025D6DC86|nr:helix-turn-helix transcriptional regulator [uncultured Clostridium sp.]MDU4882963.1 helix-turn-helix transcriptional regulator [Clostridium celatum]MDU7076136.1 helix-turn-helix transcriptional regulator [Clostridium celatum]
MLRELRKNRGISSVFIAKNLGISRDRLRRIENGISELPVDFLPKMSTMYGVTSDEVIECYFITRRRCNNDKE